MNIIEAENQFSRTGSGNECGTEERNGFPKKKTFMNLSSSSVHSKFKLIGVRFVTAFQATPCKVGLDCKLQSAMQPPQKTHKNGVHND